MRSKVRRRKIRLRTLFVFLCASLLGAGLLRVSHNVQQAEQQLAELNRSIEQEKNSIRLLNAEWAYLNNPERLEKLSAQYLDLMPPQPAAIISTPAEIPAKGEEIMAILHEAPQAVSAGSQPSVRGRR